MTDTLNFAKNPVIIPTKTAYLRVSTIDQDLEKNKADILKISQLIRVRTY